MGKRKGQNGLGVRTNERTEEIKAEDRKDERTDQSRGEDRAEDRTGQRGGENEGDDRKGDSLGQASMKFGEDIYKSQDKRPDASGDRDTHDD